MHLFLRVNYMPDYLPGTGGILRNFSFVFVTRNFYSYPAPRVAQSVKSPPAMWETLDSIPGSGRFPGGGHGSLVSLPGESRGQRSLDCSPWGKKELDTSERISLSSLYSYKVLFYGSMKIYKTYTPKRCPFHYRGLECKSSPILWFYEDLQDLHPKKMSFSL